MAKRDINTSCQSLRDVIAACSAVWHKWTHTHTFVLNRWFLEWCWPAVITTGRTRGNLPTVPRQAPGHTFFSPQMKPLKKPPNSDYISKLQTKGSACENREFGGCFERIDVRWCFTSSWIGGPADVHSAARPNTPDGTFHTSADDSERSRADRQHRPLLKTKTWKAVGWRFSCSTRLASSSIPSKQADWSGHIPSGWKWVRQEGCQSEISDLKSQQSWCPARLFLYTAEKQISVGGEKMWCVEN